MTSNLSTYAFNTAYVLLSDSQTSLERWFHLHFSHLYYYYYYLYSNSPYCNTIIMMHTLHAYTGIMLTFIWFSSLKLLRSQPGSVQWRMVRFSLLRWLFTSCHNQLQCILRLIHSLCAQITFITFSHFTTCILVLNIFNCQ